MRKPARARRLQLKPFILELDSVRGRERFGSMWMAAAQAACRSWGMNVTAWTVDDAQGFRLVKDASFTGGHDEEEG